MLIVQIGAILLALLIGSILARREYKNFTIEEKEQFKRELSHPILVVLHVLDQIGYIIFFIGFIFSSIALKYIAFVLIGLGWIINGADMWEADKKRGLIFIFLGSLTFITTSLLALNTFWI
ncbi:hypothetical protein [Sutcliffiella deserti]|uniref:hypothetical protein n=1 Tax=Sutcliffiella deserti TaxID=2875501 RepID=UPI001CBE2076|nr:hypothetical protein [Sutcliffiella deserti]